jgi:lipopolysaccharide export LptBFGC system permease protein LptF
MRFLPKKIQLYIFKQFLLSLFGSVTLFTGLYIIIKLVEQLPYFLKRTDLSLDTFINYYLYTIPYIWTYIIPISCLFATVYVLGKLNAKRTSIMSAMVPVIVAIFLMCLMVFFYDDEFIYNNYEKHQIIAQKISGSKIVSLMDQSDLTVFGKNNKIYFIRKFKPKQNEMSNVHILFLNHNYQFSKLISAKSLTYNTDKMLWTASNALIRTWETNTKFTSNTTNTAKLLNSAKNSDVPDIAFHKSISLDLDETPFHFRRAEGRTEILSSSDALMLAKKHKIMGGPYEKYMTAYYSKSAVPFLSIIIVFFGIPLSVFSSKSTLILSLFLALLTYFLMMIVTYISNSLGANGVFPPMVAGWFSNILFLGIGLYLHRKFSL